jgi:hypothetical protein
LDYDKVVMIAGGSGGSFTFGNALRVLQQWPEGKHMEFHWIVKERCESNLSRDPQKLDRT